MADQECAEDCADGVFHMSEPVPFKLWPVGTLRPSLFTGVKDGRATATREERAGRIMPDGPFGCYYNGSGEWVLIHLACGLAIPGTPNTLRMCQELAEALLASDSEWQTDFPSPDPQRAREVLARFLPEFKPIPATPARTRRRMRARR